MVPGSVQGQAGRSSEQPGLVKCPCPWLRGWNQMICKVPSNSNHSVTLLIWSFMNQYSFFLATCFPCFHSKHSWILCIFSTCTDTTVSYPLMFYGLSHKDPHEGQNCIAVQCSDSSTEQKSLSVQTWWQSRDLPSSYMWLFRNMKECRGKLHWSTWHIPTTPTAREWPPKCW